MKIVWAGSSVQESDRVRQQTKEIVRNAKAMYSEDGGKSERRV